ncbi:MAG: PEP-CTERM sorting domain-containing protein [Chthoniobacterales bacterium]|nr:PEP-CTERM sorting domain-containing protein [Chthoniobacterales bacterium]
MKTAKYILTAVALTLAVFVIGTAGSVQAQAVSDQILILNPDGSTNSNSVVIPEGGAEPFAFILGTTTVPDPNTGLPILLFNVTAGVTIFLEPGSPGGILPTTIGPGGVFMTLNDALAALLGPSDKVSDVFGITANLVGDPNLIGFGLLSDNEVGLSIGSFGLPTQLQTLTFDFETGGLQDVGNFFLTSAANTAGYKLFVQSDISEPVPEPSTWAFVLSGVGALVLLRRRKRGATVS